jgi:glycosyltransferase involved in cell wall biosynthesis
MADSVMIVAPKLGAFSETFIYRHVVGFHRLETLVFVTERLNEDIFPAPGKKIFIDPPKGMSLIGKVAQKLNLPRNPWAWSSSRVDMLVQICRSHNVRALLAHYGHFGVSLLPVIKKLGLPLLVHFHGSDATVLIRDRRYLSLLQTAWPQFTKVIVPSKFIRNKLRGVGCPDEILRVMYLGVPIPHARRVADEKGTVCFLHVGRLIEKKGVKYSIEAYARASSALPDSKFIIVGEGVEREACDALVRDLGLGGRVEMLGVQPNEKVLKLMEEADVYVQHSVTASNGDTEGLPVSTLEAQAYELPVISTRHAGIPEGVLEGKSGFLVDERDVEGMAERMVRLGGDPELRRRMGAAGRANVKANFELEKQNAKLEDLLLEVIARQ